MKIEIKSQDQCLDAALQRQIVRQIEFGLGLVAPHVRKVTVRLAPIPGQRSGNGTHCQLQIGLQHWPDLLVDDVAGDVLFAIHRSTDRACRSVRRLLRQQRDYPRALQVQY